MLWKRTGSASVLVVCTLLGAAGVDAAEGPNITPDVVYGHKDGMALTFDVLQPASQPNGAAILFIVSGGWYSVWSPPEKFNPSPQPILERGYTMFLVRHGGAPRYVVPEIVEDVRRAVRFIRTNATRWGVDPERLGVTGWSAGGHLALVIGMQSDNGLPNAPDPVLHASDRVAAVVSFMPATDLRQWMTSPPERIESLTALKFDPSKGVDYSPIAHVTPDDAPTLLIHGDKDELVPIDHSRKMLEELKKRSVPCDLLVMEGLPHGFFKGEDARRANSRMMKWFDKYLAKK